jgi:hypothetical protein
MSIAPLLPGGWAHPPPRKLPVILVVRTGIPLHANKTSPGCAADDTPQLWNLKPPT